MQLGASTRAAIALIHGAQACALLDGRDFTLPEDVQHMLLPVFSHRLLPNPEARMKGITAEPGIDEHSAKRGGAAEGMKCHVTSLLVALGALLLAALSTGSPIFLMAAILLLVLLLYSLVSVLWASRTVRLHTLLSGQNVQRGPNGAFNGAGAMRLSRCPLRRYY